MSDTDTTTVVALDGHEYPADANNNPTYWDEDLPRGSFEHETMGTLGGGSRGELVVKQANYIWRLVLQLNEVRTKNGHSAVPDFAAARKLCSFGANTWDFNLIDGLQGLLAEYKDDVPVTSKQLGLAKAFQSFLEVEADKIDALLNGKRVSALRAKLDGRKIEAKYEQVVSITEHTSQAEFQRVMHGIQRDFGFRRQAPASNEIVADTVEEAAAALSAATDATGTDKDPF